MLLSVTDVFLFESITERDGDLEDGAGFARGSTVDWDRLLEELEPQKDEAGRSYSFAVLDTIDS